MNSRLVRCSIEAGEHVVALAARQLDDVARVVGVHVEDPLAGLGVHGDDRVERVQTLRHERLHQRRRLAADEVQHVLVHGREVVDHRPQRLGERWRTRRRGWSTRCRPRRAAPGRREGSTHRRRVHVGDVGVPAMVDGRRPRARRSSRILLDDEDLRSLGKACRQGGMAPVSTSPKRAPRATWASRVEVLAAEEHDLPPQQRVADAGGSVSSSSSGRQVDAADLGPRVLGERQDIEFVRTGSVTPHLTPWEARQWRREVKQNA